MPPLLLDLPPGLAHAHREEEAVEGRNVEARHRDAAELIVAQPDGGVALPGHDPGVLAEAEIDDGGAGRPHHDANFLERTERARGGGRGRHGYRLRDVAGIFPPIDSSI
jgi:hypothetical protein